MAYAADRVKETTTSPGTATANLNGAYTGFQTYAQASTASGGAFVSGDTTTYCMTDQTNWEIGLGIWTSGTPCTLARTQVLANSLQTTALINFTASVVDVFCQAPAGLWNSPPSNSINSRTTIAADTSYIVAGYLNVNSTITVNGNLMVI
jgi:hypothetical protein